MIRVEGHDLWNLDSVARSVWDWLRITAQFLSLRVRVVFWLLRLLVHIGSGVHRSPTFLFGEVLLSLLGVVEFGGRGLLLVSRVKIELLALDWVWVIKLHHWVNLSQQLLIFTLSLKPRFFSLTFLILIDLMPNSTTINSIISISITNSNYSLIANLVPFV